jgi:hypothetical protein
MVRPLGVFVRCSEFCRPYSYLPAINPPKKQAQLYIFLHKEVVLAIGIPQKCVIWE